MTYEQDKKIIREELTPLEFNELSSIDRNAPRKYARYRRRYPEKPKNWCFESAKAWAVNAVKEGARRLSHDTGATNWME